MRVHIIATRTTAYDGTPVVQCSCGHMATPAGHDRHVRRQITSNARIVGKV